MGLEDPRDLPPAPRHLQRHWVGREHHHPHLHSSEPLTMNWGNQRDNDTDRYELEAQSRSGRAISTGSKPIDQNAVCV
jgi:hypothetical protein